MVTIELKHYTDEKFARNWENTPTTNKLRAFKSIIHILVISMLIQS